MANDFRVRKIALHLVNREWDEPLFSKEEVKLPAFEKAEDNETLDSFFSGHLNEIWKSLESEDSRTRAAEFKEDSLMKSYYESIKDDHTQFFDSSIKMAQLLHDKSKDRTASPGLLMVLWFQEVKSKKHFLALFKMDPGQYDKITLRENEAGEILLDLAVSHIKQVLPDPGGRVLKWALIPHPTSKKFNVKVKDKEGKPDDTAQYFIDFLGCTTKPSEKKQLRRIMKDLTNHANKQMGGKKGGKAVRGVVNKLAAKEFTTPHTVIKTIRGKKDFEGLESKLKNKLKDEKFKAIKIRQAAFQEMAMQYRLKNGITIKGRQDDMEAFVTVREVDKDTIEFCIQTTDYEIIYG